MNGSRVLLSALILSLLLPPALGSHNEGNNDAGGERGSSASLPPGRHYGRLGGTDTADWYDIAVDSLVDTSLGRPLIDIQVRADGGWNPALHVYAPGANDDDRPTLTGTGPFGMKAVRIAADATGHWKARVTGSGSGAYEITYIRLENDNNQGKDALSTSGITVGGTVANGMVIEGNLSRRDPGDTYKVTGANRLLVALHHAPTTDFDLEVLGPGGLIPSPTVREDDSIDTAYIHQDGNGEYTIRVTNPASVQGMYRLFVRTNPNENADEVAGNDAPETLDQAPAIGQGLRFGRVELGLDAVDSYRIAGVQAGQVIQLGLSSHKTDPTRPAVRGSLYAPDGQTLVRRVMACQGADAVNQTAGVSGDYFFRVELNTGCTTPGASGPYAFSLRLENQIEDVGRDAPSTYQNAPTPPHNQTRLGWLDEVDNVDIYRVGSLQRGHVVRGALQTLVEGFEADVQLLGPSGNAVFTTRTIGGVARIEGVAAENGNHYVKFQRFGNPADEIPWTHGLYRFLHYNVSNLPPTTVILEEPQNTPLDDDISRNFVRLEWNRNQDSDFRRYEVHAALDSPTFTPSAQTLRDNISAQGTTTSTVTGLQAGRTYTFLVRVVDTTELSSDSNRRTVTTEGSAVGNQPPVLQNGRVTPSEGDPSTVFTFRVNYRDGDNDPPARKRVVIDGTPSEMQVGADTDYRDGADFSFATSLPPGTHSFFFDFSDGTSDARDPPVDAYSGPRVTTTGNQPPTVEATASPSSGSPPLRVTFTANANDPENGALTYEWDFDNSNGFQVQATGRTVTHTYEQPGTYTATVRVRDPQGSLATDSVTVSVSSEQNNPPSTAPTATPSQGTAPLTVQFDAKARDTDGTIQTYEWDFDNSDGLQNQASTATPTHTYTKAGSFIATVIVRDNKGSTAQGSVQVLVRTSGNSPPNLQLLANPESGNAPLTVNFTAEASDPDGGPITISWDFDVANGITSEAQGQQVTHLFASEGTYTVLATARDNQGAAATATVNIRVRAGSGGPGPDNSLINITATPSEGQAPLTVEFRADSTDAGLSFVRYEWDFGDASAISTEPTPTHVFDSPGTYVVKLQAFDAGGNVYVASKEIEVKKKGGSPGFEAGLAAVAVLAVLAAMAVRQRRSDRF